MSPYDTSPWATRALFIVVALLAQFTYPQVLTPSQITISHRKPIRATSTCGEIQGQPVNEIYCSLTGSSAYNPVNPYSYQNDDESIVWNKNENARVFGGHGCGFCNAGNENSHPASNMVDGNNSWWMSPPLSRGLQHNEINITIDLEQEFHVAYVWIQMANSPRPGSWVLERSTDHGQTYKPWFHFAENAAECMRRFGVESLSPISEDDSVTCRTDQALLQPLENAEMVIKILEHRPSSLKFATSEVLQNFTRATNIRLRLLGTRTLQGHLMEMNEWRDPTVTRRYFYAIKEIMIGGRCVCNGHAVTCDILEPQRPKSLLCRCEHNTCGDMCERCCPGYVQKAWQPATAHNNFTCEACNCFGRSNECYYDEQVDLNKQSMDSKGNYEGGGVCVNCRDNTEGINCNKCSYGYFRPAGVTWDEPQPCKACDCDPDKHTGSCAEETGKCECQARFVGENCDQCALGYYDPPECKPCECFVNGTVGDVCLPEDGQCPCKPGFGGTFCDTCADGFTNVTAGCVECVCDATGSEHSNCSAATGQCECKPAYAGLSCDKCQVGYFGDDCKFCNCDPMGTEGGVCDQTTGQCLCKEGFAGDKCDRCDIAYYGYPNCKACACDGAGITSPECDSTSGQCPCNGNFTGRTCDKCAAGFYNYPDCRGCECLVAGAKGQTCDNQGQCYCKGNFEGERCDRCKPNFYNFPICEECNCNPSGVTRDFQGCDKVSPGELCSCRKHVTGRICDQCKPTFWDLQYHHEDGCRSCECNTNGTISGLNTCDLKSGQCMCKKNAAGRTCDQCAEGFYRLNSYNQLGCESCHCDIGGALRAECDINSGQCKCRPRVTGLRCDRPIENHYFPTLWHNQYEAEDAHTEDQRPVRFAVDPEQFSNFSWRGYAVFSPIQEKILIDVDIAKASVYRLLFRYRNPTPVPITATVSVAPRFTHTHDVEQSGKATFAPGDSPAMKEITVDGKPFVLNPGKWSLAISTKQRLFLDYVVVLPAEYYEGSALRQRAPQPCLSHSTKNTTCVDLIYPPIPASSRVFVDMEKVPFNYVNEDGSLTPLELVPVEILPSEITGPAGFIRADENPRTVEAKLDVPETGEYVVVIEYHNREETDGNVGVGVSQGYKDVMNGNVVIHHCPYATFCRELVSSEGTIPFIPLEKGEATVRLNIKPNHEFGLAAVHLIKKEDFSSEYLQQVPVCIRKDGRCVPQSYPPASESVVTEAESGPNMEKSILGDKLPFPVSNSKEMRVVPLDDAQATIEISGVVPTRGHYMFLVHYFNPDNTPIDIDVLLQNEHYFQGDSCNSFACYNKYSSRFLFNATVPLAFCPSISGCRALIRDKERPDVIQFFMDDKYTATFYHNASQKGPIYIDSITAVPYNSFKDKLMEPLALDLSNEFLKECFEENLRNHPESVSDFCKQKIFSLTTDFNSAALSCDCVAQGSESFQCEEYGGQCKCKPNVIGRRCERCAPGYYNFPECIKCSCNAGQQCDERTGQCFCPPHVEGQSCDRCVSNAFGYDPLIGCQKCGCHPQGSEGGNLVCDPESGQCLCRESMGGRQCDRCLAGFYGFPHCYGCSCNRDGTTEEICDATNAQCKCKENVYGARCEACKAGTFDLSAENPLGCVNCFCFGVTDSCRSSMFPVTTMSVDMSSFLTTDDSGMVDNKDDTVLYTSEETSPNSVYFIVPIVTNDYTTSYGLKLTFKLSAVPRVGKKKMNSDADIRLTGANMTIEHWATEQPTNPEEQFTVKCKLVPENFLTTEGKPVTREELMKVLHSLQNITLKASYFDHPKTSTLYEFGLEISEPNGADSVIKASSVEQCQCPAPYTGPSCQLCASGYHRVSSGSFLGACVPCECNGHSATCDPDTGICTDCEHNTHGDHCEFCDEGHYGNATNGSPYDCMACACPFAPSNNFAKSCDVSEEGQLLQCNCKPGYTGDRCDRCDAGYFGQPQQVGGSCEPCQCNGNNNLTDSRACHPVSGDCYLCEQNTDGRHCEWCAQWFYGDAVSAKNCSSCECDQCGSQYCDNRSGGCECKTNVEGDSCDRCKPDHWGFSKCQGCQACHCGTAAFNTQCNVENGQCTCRPGASGMRCEQCEHGYWNYGEHGCDKCDCESDLSMGTVCDVRTGQCHCQEGATGSRCDQCLPSYLRIPTHGCRRCDECVHHLIGDVDNLELEIDVLGTAIANISSATIVGARLARNKKEFNDISEITKMLNDEENSFGNFFGDASDILTNSTQILHKLVRTKNHSNNSAIASKSLTVNGTEFLNDVMKKAQRARQSVRSLAEIALAIGSSSKAVNVDPRLLREAEETLMSLETTSADPYPEKAQSVPGKLKEIQDKIQVETDKLEKQKESFESQKKKAEELAAYLNSAQQLLKESKSKTDKANNVAKMLQLAKVQNLVAAISDDLERVETVKGEFQKINIAIGNITESIKDNREALSQSVNSLNETRNDIAEAVEAAKKRVRREEKPLVDMELINAKAEEMRLQAISLRQAFDNNKADSDRAVEAANAYSKIAETLLDAKEKIDRAIVLLEDETQYAEAVQNAKDKPIPADMKDKIAEFSKNLAHDVKEAEKLKKQLEQLTEMAEKLRKRKDAVKNRIPNYDRTLLGGLDNKAKEIHEIKAAIDANIEETRAKISEIAGKAEEITEKANSAMEGIRLARRNAVQLQSLAPVVASKFEELKKLSAVRSGKVDSITGKVSEIKEMIAAARNAANKIKLGAHFNRGSSLDLNIPQRVTRSAAHADISFYFRTEEQHGIPFFFGNEETAVGSRAVPTADYVAAEIEYGRLKITVDLGDAPAVVKLETLVNDGLWRRLNIERIGKTVNATLSKPNSVETAETKSSVAGGNKSVLNLNQQISKLFIGGIPTTARISKDLYNRDFVGDIELLKLHGEPIGLWNTKEKGNVNVGGAQKKPKMTDNADELVISLDGEGYSSYKPSHWNPRKATKISLSFLTFSPQGLLFFVGKDRDFMSLELFDGLIKLSVDLGSGTEQFMTENSNYNDGKWHTVSIVREEKHVKITVDEEVVEGDVPGKDSEMSVTEFLYIGGTPSGLPVRTTMVPLRGCIKQVKLGSDEVDLENSHASKGVRSGCPLHTVRTVSFLSDRTTAEFSNATEFSGDVSVTFKFKTRSIRQPSSVFTVTDDEDSVLSATINEDGILTVTSGNDVATLELAASPDERWHYVSIRKTDHVIRIDADDSFSNEVARKEHDESNPDATYLSASFGKSGAFPSFVGCIGDVTLNGKLLDFIKADIKEISLNGCSLSDDENVAATTTTTTSAPTDSDIAVLPNDDSEDEETTTTTTTSTEEPTEEPAEMKDQPIYVPPNSKRDSSFDFPDHFESVDLSVRPDGHCSLPEDALVQFEDAEGFNFGTQQHSRIEYDVLPDAFDKSGEFSFKIRPTSDNGVVFIAGNKRTEQNKNNDHIAVILEHGRVIFTYDTGSGKVVIKSDKSIIDGRWHSIKVSRRGKSAHLIVDDDSYESEGAANQNEDLIDTQPPFYLGGVPSDFASVVRSLVPGTRSQFSGCIKDFRLNGKSLNNGKEFGTEQCSQFSEPGMYFGKDGGYAIVQKDYEVGHSFGLEVEIRPRMKNGVLFSVGVLDYVAVEFVNGSIKTTVGSASGMEDLWHHPTNENEYCDGQWQSFKIAKKKNLLTVTVNGKAQIRMMKKAKEEVLTKDPLYFGGLPEGITKNKGITTDKPFVGCIRFISFGLKKDRKMLRRKKEINTERFDVYGDVNRHGCPAI
ncbi:hypothetical protein L3Y34_005063 [Caenorhabditis briggsae]|uniref:Protein CBR-EPI-1 n=1 Tax=Caenorhabditis briggsae TaxID=6238 RepID=A0AAE9D5N7_CAEBR|nr:hypothetical protein L3Y34_005063 [Caenorhabditis briggsae]